MDITTYGGAYAAVVSVLQLIEQIKLHHAHRPIFLDEELRHIESLYDMVRSLQDFLERYSQRRSYGAEALVKRIADAAYAAEDIIELHVVDDIILTQSHMAEDITELHVVDAIILPPSLKKDFTKGKNFFAGSTSQEKKSSTHFSQGLQKVIEDVEFCRKEAVMIETNSHHRDFVSLRYFPNMHNTMVGFDEHLDRIMAMLLSNESNLKFIPITGMGGIGKTTLATNIYHHHSIVKNYDLRSWCTISETNNLREIFLSLLHELGVRTNLEEQRIGDYQLGDMLHKNLYGKRYLIVIDDLWNGKIWDELRRFFPDKCNRSRVMVTTRLSGVAKYVNSSYLHKLNLVDKSTSWEILCSKIFGLRECPLELEEIGRKIAINCKGLPLSIVVIGGLLANSKTREFWEYVAEDTLQIVSAEDNDHCLEILSLSYKHLPIHLRPCFLYMGVFPENHKIHVSRLIKLWVAEGFLKSNETKSLEEVAEEYLKDLIERHLIMVDVRGSIGSIKICSIHDLLRNLCIREALRERFLYVTKVRNIHVTEVHDLHISHDINDQNRIVFYSDQYAKSFNHRISHALQSTTFVRSVTSDFHWNVSFPYNFRLLRLFNGSYDYSQEGNLVNLRHIDLTNRQTNTLFSTIGKLWNLQTLILRGDIITAPPEIWELFHLRHLLIYESGHVSAPPNGPHSRMYGEDVLVLENLQTIGRIVNFRLTDDTIRRIPNIKKLRIIYEDQIPKLERSELCLYNLQHLGKLQSLYFRLPLNELDFVQELVFPVSLKKLVIDGCNAHHFEDIIVRVGPLPNLEKLKLLYFRSGDKWSVEGEFISLKLLEIGHCSRLEYWTADGTNFPVLERLVLTSMNLEIPFDFFYMHTLESVQLKSCSDRTIASANNILEEQESFGNDHFSVRVS